MLFDYYYLIQPLKWNPEKKNKAQSLIKKDENRKKNYVFHYIT